MYIIFSISLPLPSIHPPSSCDWPCFKWPGWRAKVGKYVEKSPKDADLWVFLTGSKSKYGLGLTLQGTVCSRDRGDRVSMNQYLGNKFGEGPDKYTAEVMYFQ